MSAQPTARPWALVRHWPLLITAASEANKPIGAASNPKDDRGYATVIAESRFDDITVRDHPEVAARFPHRRVNGEQAKADAALIVAAVNDYDRLRAVEAAALEWRDAHRAQLVEIARISNHGTDAAAMAAVKRAIDSTDALRAVLARPAEEERG